MKQPDMFKKQRQNYLIEETDSESEKHDDFAFDTKVRHVGAHPTLSAIISPRHYPLFIMTSLFGKKLNFSIDIFNSK